MNSMRNYDVICFDFNSYWVSETYKITNKFNTFHCIQSQRLAESVLNRASILLSNRIQSFLFHCAMDFRTVSII